jgi:hypothetical protein
MEMNSMVQQGLPRWTKTITPVTIVALIIVMLVSPAYARAPTVKDIQSGDTIFLYEQNLNITALHGSTPGAAVRSLHHYSDVAAQASDNTIIVVDETNFDILDADVGGTYGPYYAWGDTGPILEGGRALFVDIEQPALSLDVVLASPNHVESVQGLSISQGTSVAFKITAPRVGSSYRAVGVSPAQVDVVLMRPGGSETTFFGGREFSGLNVTGTQFFTDDPGMPGPFSLAGLEAGSYSFQARWRTPQEFADYAKDSDPVSFTVRGSPGGVTITQTTTAGTTTTTVATTAPTTAATTVATTPTTQTTSPAMTSPPTTATTAPTTSPTQAPAPIAAGLAAFGIALALGARRRN